MRIVTEFHGGSPVAVLVELATVQTPALRADIEAKGKARRGRCRLGWATYKRLLRKHATDTGERGK